MKIAIHLGSSILGHALQEQLRNVQEVDDVVMVHPGSGDDAVEADFVITDAHTIKQHRPPSLSRAKTILLDYGLSEDTISSLLITSKVDGIMTPDADLCLLMKAFHAVNSGQIWIDNCKIKALVNFAENTRDSVLEKNLSNKEREVIINVSQGLTNREIASRLYISEQTVKTHINNIFKKTNMTRRTQLVPLGIKLTADLMEH
jgi:DNA-binding NarL/FixJ family response regulator